MENLAQRILQLRKQHGLSQEELADKMNVSRQAVSKWESEQSTPDLENVLALCEIFDVTSDYLLRGITTEKDGKQQSTVLTSRILYIGSTAMIAIGLLLGIGGWYGSQTASVIWGAMIVQVVGIAGYCIAKLLSNAQPSKLVRGLNIMLLSFMPVSMLSGGLMMATFHYGWIAPYPDTWQHIVLFVFLMSILCWLVCSKLNRPSQEKKDA